MKAIIKWTSKKVLLSKSVFLFCFGEKCMSGKIIEFKKLNVMNEFEILVNFIEPDYFKEDIIIDNNFTINEASKILGTGNVTETQS
jgi:hypothetical protein